MSTHNIQFHDKIRKFTLYICFLELSGEFRQKRVRITMVNEPSVFEPSRFDCSL